MALSPWGRRWNKIQGVVFSIFSSELHSASSLAPWMSQGLTGSHVDQCISPLAYLATYPLHPAGQPSHCLTPLACKLGQRRLEISRKKGSDLVLPPELDPDVHNATGVPTRFSRQVTTEIPSGQDRALTYFSCCPCCQPTCK